MSSKATIDISWGIRIPISFNRTSAPIVIRLLATKIAVGRRARPKKWLTSPYPLRSLNSPSAKFVADVCRLAQCNVPKGRVLLQEFVGRIVLRPNGATLVAVVQGNLAALLPVEGRLLGDNLGAGGPEKELYNWPVVARAIA